MAKITDTFILRVPPPKGPGIPADLDIISASEDQTLVAGEDYYVGFTYTLGYPKTHETPFQVTWKKIYKDGSSVETTAPGGTFTPRKPQEMDSKGKPIALNATQIGWLEGTLPEEADVNYEGTIGMTQPELPS